MIRVWIYVPITTCFIPELIIAFVQAPVRPLVEQGSKVINKVVSALGVPV